jgi:hypothetical protein
MGRRKTQRGRRLTWYYLFPVSSPIAVLGLEGSRGPSQHFTTKMKGG